MRDTVLPWRNWWRLLVVATWLTLFGSSALAGVLPSDPVEDLRQNLADWRFDLDPRQHSSQEQNLKKHVVALKTTSDLSRALLLEAWDRVLQSGEAGFQEQAPGWKIYQELTKKFVQQVKPVLAAGDPTKKLALAHLASDIGRQLQQRQQSKPATPEPVRPLPLIRELRSLLVQLTADTNEDVRATAVAGLGSLAGQTEQTLGVLEKLLRSDHESDRIAAARALTAQLRIVHERFRRLRSLGQQEPLVLAAPAMLKLAGKGLTDAHPQVRQQSLKALQEGGLLLRALAMAERRLQQFRRNFPGGLQPVPPSDAPPPGVPDQSDKYAPLQPLRTSLKDYLPAVTQALKDSATENRISASAVLETIATIRREERHIPAELPQKPPEDLFGPELRKAVPVLAKNLQHADVTVQLASIYVLETLAEEAAPAAEAVAAVVKDKNAFVRWGVVRTLGRMAPQKTAVSVPALVIALKDENVPVRFTAVAALKGYGPAAKAAVPGLIHLLKAKDEDMHESVLLTLLAIGADAEPALPQMVAVLSSANPKVRQTAAYVLGRLGRATPGVVAGLRRALEDTDADVRLAASEALLDLQ